MKFLPRTIFGRTLLVLLLGLTVSHLIGLALYAGERRQALTAAGGRWVAERIAAVAEAAENVPATERRHLVRTFLEPGFRVTWTERSVLTEESSDWRARLVRQVIRDHLGALPAERIRVAYGRTSGEDWWRSGHRRWWRERMHWLGATVGHMEGGDATTHPVPHMGQGPRAWHSDRLVEVSLQMTDKSWLNFAAPAIPVRPFGSSPYLLSMVLATATVLALSAWAVRRATAPLALFARAAERLGIDVDAPALAEEGPREVRRAAAAFNQMQRRLGRFIRDRIQMLAAVSHDLRTPITRLRLRAEFVEDADQRNKMLADLEQMESMISATLAFARDDAAEEPRKTFDLGVLLQDLCDDAADAGHAAAYEGAPPPCLWRPSDGAEAGLRQPHRQRHQVRWHGQGGAGDGRRRHHRGRRGRRSRHCGRRTGQGLRSLLQGRSVAQPRKRRHGPGAGGGALRCPRPRR